MKRVLAFSFFPANAPPGNGGESRLLNFYRALSATHHVTLLSSAHPNVPERRVYHGSNFVELRIPKDDHFQEAYADRLALSSGGDLSAIALAASAEWITPLHQAYLEAYRDCDLVIHESPFTVAYDIFCGLDGKPRVYNSYNCESRLYRELHPDEVSRPLWDEVADCETQLLQAADLVLYCNPDDRQAFAELAPQAHYEAIYTPHGVTPLRLSRSDGRGGSVRSAVFMGSAHPPNVRAATYVVEVLAPRFPDIEFHIVGNCLARGRYPDNLVRHGFLDEAAKDRLLDDVDLALNPMTQGGGANIKMFDLLSRGIPLLTTPFGARGIDGLGAEHCVMAPIEAFPDALGKWRDANHELQALGVAGRDYVLQHYGWDRVIQPFLQRLSAGDLATERPGHLLTLNDYDSFNNGGGGGVRTRELCLAAAPACPVVFLCFADNRRLRKYQPAPGVTLVCVPKSASHQRALDQSRGVYHVAVDDIIASRYCLENSVLCALYEVLREDSVAIMVEHCYLAPLPMAFGDRFVYSSQNCESTLKQGVLAGHPHGETLVAEVAALEKRCCESAGAILAVSDEDAAEFTRLADSAGPIITLRNGASAVTAPSAAALSAVSESIKRERSVFFVGSAHPPNIEAVHFILEELAPAAPDCQFHIVGSVCLAFSQRRVDNVHFWGVVDDDRKNAIAQSCAVAINPVIEGGGSNIKTADYCANGLFTLTTDFGLRGYPQDARNFCLVSRREDFRAHVDDALARGLAASSSDIRRYFDENLSMAANARALVPLLQRLRSIRKRVLFVSYRYSSPALGGAEAYVQRLIQALDESDRYQIDVLATDVAGIHEDGRFASSYSRDPNAACVTGLANVRYGKFPVDSSRPARQALRELWSVQPAFERAVYMRVAASLGEDCLAWGWADHGGVAHEGRWMFTDCGLHLCAAGSVVLHGFTLAPVALDVIAQSGEVIESRSLSGRFRLELQVGAGALRFASSAPVPQSPELRPLALFVDQLWLNDERFDLSAPALINRLPGSQAAQIQHLYDASQETRGRSGLSLTALRGPASRGLEGFLREQVSQYDLVVTHNNVFYTATLAVREARAQGVPVIAIPHAHLDDDFYHFPDVHESVINADLALLSPGVACDFYRSLGGSVAYHSPGIDAGETFNESDLEAFRAVYPDRGPFFLVLGRKAAAKGYLAVIEAAASLAGGPKSRVLMIGPDDDGAPLADAHVIYLGRQPREVVRGALMSCVALVNMSRSESFGIVLLEAWLAGKPVIANRDCAAFLDLAVHEGNALLAATPAELRAAMMRLLEEPDLARRLGQAGRSLALEYDWKVKGDEFLAHCETLTARGAAQPVPPGSNHSTG